MPITQERIELLLKEYEALYQEYMDVWETLGMHIKHATDANDLEYEVTKFFQEYPRMQFSAKMEFERIYFKRFAKSNKAAKLRQQNYRRDQGKKTREQNKGIAKSSGEEAADRLIEIQKQIEKEDANNLIENAFPLKTNPNVQTNVTVQLTEEEKQRALKKYGIVPSDELMTLSEPDEMDMTTDFNQLDDED